MTIYEFLAAQAEYLEGEAEQIDQLGDEQCGAGNWIGVAHCFASAETLRAIASAYRRSIPTEDHDFDCTLADIVDLPEVAA